MMHQEKVKRGRQCASWGRYQVTVTVVGRRARGKLRICADCAAAALRLLSSRAAGERANKLRAVP